MHLEIDSQHCFKNKKEKEEVHYWNANVRVLPRIIKDDIYWSSFWVERMKYFHKHRRPTRRINYGAEEDLREINHIGEHKDIKIIKMTKKWNTMRCINVL
jgi:hypothetical protein